MKENYTYLTIEETKNLTPDQLLKNYGNYVKSLVRYYASDFKYASFYDDLLQAGILGLFKAHEKYDVTKGVYFYLYSKPYIVAEIKQQLLFLSGPINMSETHHRVKKINLNFSNIEDNYTIHQPEISTKDIKIIKLNKLFNKIFNLINSDVNTSKKFKDSIIKRINYEKYINSNSPNRMCYLNLEDKKYLKEEIYHKLNSEELEDALI